MFRDSTKALTWRGHCSCIWCNRTSKLSRQCRLITSSREELQPEISSLICTQVMWLHFVSSQLNRRLISFTRCLPAPLTACIWSSWGVNSMSFVHWRFRNNLQKFQHTLSSCLQMVGRFQWTNAMEGWISLLTGQLAKSNEIVFSFFFFKRKKMVQSQV